MWYDVWFLRYAAWQTELFVILDHFLPFYPSNNPANQNFEKMKKIHGCIIILHMRTINGNCIIYSSWDMELDRQNFLSFWNLKNQNFEKMKKMPGDIIILHMCTKNYDHMMYGSWDVVCNGQTEKVTWWVPHIKDRRRINVCSITYNKMVGMVCARRWEKQK